MTAQPTNNGAPQPETDTRAMVVSADPRSSVLAFEPANIDEGLKLCEKLLKSGLLPKTIQTPEQAFVIMVAGREMGLRFMQSFRLLHVFDGKIITSAQLIIGKCKERVSICKYFTLICGSSPCQCKHSRPNEPHATWETLRVGAPKPTRITFTLEDAKNAGLLGKDNWKKYPWQMCQNRGGAVLSRAEYADIVGGLYDEDEIPVPHIEVTSSPSTSNAPGTIDAQFIGSIDDLLEELGRATTDADCVAVGVKMVNRRTQITAADEQILRTKIADRRAEPAIAATAWQKKGEPPKEAPKAETSQPQPTPQPAAPEAPKSEPKARTSQPEPEPTPKEKPQKRAWEACGAENDSCVCSRPKDHDGSHYDEKADAEWGGS